MLYSSNKKSNRLPSANSIAKSHDRMKVYWEIYLKHYEEIFKAQTQRALGINASSLFEKQGLEAIQYTLHKLHYQFGGESWG